MHMKSIEGQDPPSPQGVAVWGGEVGATSVKCPQRGQAGRGLWEHKWEQGGPQGSHEKAWRAAVGSCLGMGVRPTSVWFPQGDLT